jgi:hypothetical protein
MKESGMYLLELRLSVEGGEELRSGNENENENLFAISIGHGAMEWATAREAGGRGLHNSAYVQFLLSRTSVHQ